LLVPDTGMLPSTVTVSGAETYASAARAGLGLIQAPRYRLEADFHRGTLVPVLTATPPTRTPVSALYPRAKHVSPRLRVFIDWLGKRFQNETATGCA
jgi:DNA-binding transcriptional LysR family regulator